MRLGMTGTVGIGYRLAGYHSSPFQGAVARTAPFSTVRFEAMPLQQNEKPAAPKPKVGWMRNMVLLTAALLGLVPQLPGRMTMAKSLSENPTTNESYTEPLSEAVKLQCEELLQARLKRYGLKLNKNKELSLKETETFFLGSSKKLTKPEAYLRTFFEQLRTAPVNPSAKVLGVSHAALLKEIYRVNENRDREMSEYEVIQNVWGPTALQAIEAEAQRIGFQDMEGLRKRLKTPFCASFEEMTCNLHLAPDYRDVHMLNAIHAMYNLALVKEITNEKDEARVTAFLLQLLTRTGHIPMPKKFDAKKNSLEVQQESIVLEEGAHPQAKAYTVLTEKIKYNIQDGSVIERSPVGKPEQHKLFELSLFNTDQSVLEKVLNPKIEEALTLPQNQEHFKALKKDLTHALYQARNSTDFLNLGQLSLQALLSPILEDFKRSLGLNPKKHKLLIEDQNPNGDFMGYRCTDENIRLYLKELLGKYAHLVQEGYSEEEIAAILSQQLVESIAHESTHAYVMPLVKRYQDDPKAIEADPNLAPLIPALKSFDFNWSHYNSVASSRLLKNTSYHTDQPLEKIAYTLQTLAGTVYRERFLEP